MLVINIYLYDKENKKHFLHSIYNLHIKFAE